MTTYTTYIQNIIKLINYTYDSSLLKSTKVIILTCGQFTPVRHKIKKKKTYTKGNTYPKGTTYPKGKLGVGRLRIGIGL